MSNVQGYYYALRSLVLLFRTAKCYQAMESSCDRYLLTG